LLSYQRNAVTIKKAAFDRECSSIILAIAIPRLDLRQSHQLSLEYDIHVALATVSTIAYFFEFVKSFFKKTEKVHF
jgi:hypothetical protein